MMTKANDEIADLKEKLKAITQKFNSVRKERDTLKQDKKELEEEIMQL